MHRFGSKRYFHDRTVFLYASGLQSAWRSSLRGVEGGDGESVADKVHTRGCVTKSISNVALENGIPAITRLHLIHDLSTHCVSVSLGHTEFLRTNVKHHISIFRWLSQMSAFQPERWSSSRIDSLCVLNWMYFEWREWTYVYIHEWITVAADAWKHWHTGEVVSQLTGRECIARFEIHSIKSLFPKPVGSWIPIIMVFNMDKCSGSVSGEHFTFQHRQ